MNFDASTMCQLIGMNGKTPTDIVFSFTGFAARGGQAGHRANEAATGKGRVASTNRAAEARGRNFMGVLSYARPLGRGLYRPRVSETSCS